MREQGDAARVAGQAAAQAARHGAPADGRGDPHRQHGDGSAVQQAVPCKAVSSKAVPFKAVPFKAVLRDGVRSSAAKTGFPGPGGDLHAVAGGELAVDAAQVGLDRGE
ncbi:hypothetical protein GCM10010411_36190 [Actinomadura fulvescens]|uniref:Uncharacterized protein n=1 Tax=Actinomadura fulvescens TaxID=46160 RepID=A0ABN3PTY2_9ACTN